MKRKAQTAQVEMRVLNRMLETNRNGLSSIQEDRVEEKEPSPPPRYQERNVYQEGGPGNIVSQENTDIYSDENIYSDVEDTVNITHACVV